MSSPSKQDAEVFAKFIQGKKILIADASSTARSVLFKVFQELGAKNNQITLSNAFKQAQELITSGKPHIVCAEYDLGRNSGLDLFQTLRAQQPAAAKECIFLLCTGNTSQSAVARAAEEDIDGYILKPFTPEIIRSTIMKAAIAKIKPSPYMQLIEKGKNLLTEKNWDEAEKTFKEAAPLDPSPSLALYYIGQVKFLRNIFDQAKGNYSKGLEFNKIHYKCLIGMYETLMTQKSHEEAYDIVKRVSQYFPANPKRLAEVLRLAITTKKYEDVERYYAVFCNIDDRDETLIKYVCAALVVCGKYYLQTKNKTRAIELFTKAAATGQGRMASLKPIVQTLIEFELLSDAQNFLQKFPPEAQSGSDYLLLKFQIINGKGNRGLAIEMGRELLAKGVQDENLYAIMIQATGLSKMNSQSQDLMYNAVQKYPKYKEIFEGIFKDPNSKWKFG